MKTYEELLEENQKLQEQINIIAPKFLAYRGYILSLLEVGEDACELLEQIGLEDEYGYNALRDRIKTLRGIVQ